MSNVVFTICTKNYIGLALILKESLKKHNSNCDFFIFVADEKDDNTILPKNTYIIKELKLFSEDKWFELAFKYNVTEFCTCLKPYICKWLFENSKAQKVFYMDPDLFFFADAKPLFDGLDDYLIELTPHFLSFPETKQSKYFEDEIRYSGIFNLGFLGIKRDEKVLKMLSWWGNNLLDKCFCDGATFQFTDQKWMDFMPLFFKSNEIHIVRKFGWNVAPWNFFERKIIIENENIFVCDRNDPSIKENLLFAHFSGFKYKELLNDTVVQVNSGHENNYSDADDLLKIYIDELKAKKEFLVAYFNKKYTYAIYNCGIGIEKIHRRLYRSLLLNGFEKPTNPFNCNDVFYKALKSNGMFEFDNGAIEKIKNNEHYVRAKLKKVNILFRMFFKLLGCEKYLTLIRFLHRYTKFENQSFLINKNNISWL